MIIDLSSRKNMFYWQTDRPLEPLDNKKIFLDRRNKFDKNLTKKAIIFGMMKAGKSKEESQVVSIGEPSHFGSINNVACAELADGTKIIIRSHPQEVKNGYLWVERLASLTANNIGVPTYKTYYVYDQRKEFDFDFMIIERLPGKTMQELWPINDQLDKKLVYETGKYMAMIHQVETKNYGFFDNKIAKNENKLVGQYKEFYEHIFSGLDNNLKFLVDQKVINNQQGKSVEKILFNNKGLMKTKAVLIHNDIADWNQIVYKNHISGMIDWDECFSGDPVCDFAQWSLFFDEKRMRNLISGYQEVTKLPDNFSEKMHVYNIRYLVSKMVLRKKRLLVEPGNQFIIDRIKRGFEVIKKEFVYFKI